MQILRRLYQASGDLNGVTRDGIDADYHDANTYILERPDGLIYFHRPRRHVEEALNEALMPWR